MEMREYFNFCHHSDKVAIWFWTDQHLLVLHFQESAGTWWLSQHQVDHKRLWEEQIYLEITVGAALRVTHPTIAHLGIFSYPMWTTRPSFQNVQQWYVCKNLWDLQLVNIIQVPYFLFTLPHCCRRPIPVRDANCYHDPVGGVGEVMYLLITIYSGPWGVGSVIPQKPMSSLSSR